MYEDAKLIPHIELPYYSALWHLSKSEELYLKSIEGYCTEVPRPRAGDLMVVKIALAFSHACIVLDWPTIVHAKMGRGVLLTNAENDGELIGRKRRFFSFWGRENG